MLLTTQTTRLLGYQNFNFTKNAKKDDKLVYMVLFAYISWLDTYSHLSGYKLIQVHLRCSFRSLVYPQIHYKRQKCESVVLGSYIRPNPQFKSFKEQGIKEKTSQTLVIDCYFRLAKSVLLMFGCRTNQKLNIIQLRCSKVNDILKCVQVCEKGS